MTDQTVIELINNDTHHKIWLCPDHVSDNTFQTNTLLKGIECTRYTVPDKLQDKKIKKHFLEDNFLCIIWENDGSLEREKLEAIEDI